MRLGKAGLIAATGGCWFIVGVGLLTFGLRLIAQRIEGGGLPNQLIAKLSLLSGGKEQAGLVLICFGLIVGFIKGRYILVKTVQRVSERIIKLESPIKISQVYSRGYLILIGGMIALGMGIKILQIPQEIRGTIDIAIGSALINGAMLYFRSAVAVRKSV